MKKIFCFIIILIIIFCFKLSDSKAVTENAFNFSNSFDVGNFMSNNYYRWKCDPDTKQCEKTQTKTKDDFGTESECKASCGKNTNSLFTINNNFNNLSYQTTTTTKVAYNSFNGFNVSNNFQINSAATTTKPTYINQSLSGLSGLDLFAVTTKPITPQNSPPLDVSSLISGFSLDKDTSLTMEKQGQPKSTTNGFISGLLEGLGIVKPNSMLEESDSILSIPKTSDSDEVTPLGFNPVTDYCNVEFVKASFRTELKQISLSTELSECTGEQYPIYFSMEYIDNKDKSQEIYIKDYAGDGGFDNNFMIPDDIKILDGKTKVIFNVYQCRPDENWHRLLNFDSQCLNDIKSHKTNYYKQDSYEKEFTGLNGISGSTNTCTYNITIPVENRTYTEGNDDILPVSINIKCQDGKGGQISTKVYVNYSITCQRTNGVTIKDYPNYNGEMIINYTESKDYAIALFNLRTDFYRYGDINKCLLSITLHDDLGNSKQLSSKFGVQSCIWDLKNNDSYKTKFYLDDPYIPFEMHTRCNNFNIYAMEGIYIECTNKMIDRAKLQDIMLGGFEAKFWYKKSDKDFVLSLDNFVNYLKYENKNWENLTCTVITMIRKGEDDHAYWSPFAKTAQITIYNENRPQSEYPFPSIKASTIQPSPTTSTTAGKGGGGNPKPNAITRIVDFFKSWFQ